MRLSLFAICLACPLYAQVFEPVEIVPHVYEGGWEHFVGGGLASFDCNGDGFPELYAAGGSAAAALYRNESGASLRFVRDTPESLAIEGVTGAYPLDFNNDGFTDLAVLRVGENFLMQGGPNCSFTNYDGLQADWGQSWTTAFSATWEGGAEFPTLVFGNYVDRANPDGPFGTCDIHHLFRPTEIGYGAASELGPGYCTLSMLFSDWARSGRQDLRVSNDRHYYVRGGQEQLWAMEDTPRLFGIQDGWIKHELWGMGIASRDISGDGLADVFLTSMGDQRFQVREGSGPTFNDAAFNNGLTAHRPFVGDDGRPSTGWHAVFGDVQNDGFDDLFVAKGNVEQMPGNAFDDPNNLLIQTRDGFVERAHQAGVASLARSRGAVLVDFDLDGRLDLAVVNRRAPMEIYRNVTSEVGNFLTIDPRQTGNNTNAVGAWIEVQVGDRTAVREITIGGGHAGGQLGPQHFGIGTETSATVRIIWPDKSKSDWVEVQAGRNAVLSRAGAGLTVDF